MMTVHAGRAASCGVAPPALKWSISTPAIYNIYQKAGGDKFCKVVERSLPAYILRLVLLGELRHVKPVKGNVMGSAAHGNDSKKRYAYGKEIRQVQGQGHKAEPHPRNKLCHHYKELLGLENLQERAPEELDRPREHDYRSPQGNLTHTMFRTTNGIPMAKYALGTHARGECPLFTIMRPGFVTSLQI